MLPSLNDIALFAFIAAAGRLAVPTDARPWVLTAICAPVLTFAGALEAGYWFTSRNTLSGPDTVILLELAKAYLFVNLSFSVALDAINISLLAGWIRHIAYFYVADHLLTTYQDGLIRPFLLAALPSAILAWGHLVPTWRSDRLFGATILVTRIILPIVFAIQMRFTDFLWSVIGIAITVHLFYFGILLAKHRS